MVMLRQQKKSVLILFIIALTRSSYVQKPRQTAIADPSHTAAPMSTSPGKYFTQLPAAPQVRDAARRDRSPAHAPQRLTKNDLALSPQISRSLTMTGTAATCVATSLGPAVTDAATSQLIIITAFIGMFFAMYLMRQVAKVKLDVGSEDVWLLEKGEKKDTAWDQNDRVRSAFAHLLHPVPTEGCDHPAPCVG